MNRAKWTPCASLHRGPMIRGIPPREASDRMTIFQARFDELWRKFETYSAGEELFGLPITDYPDLQRIKRVRMEIGSHGRRMSGMLGLLGIGSTAKAVHSV